MFIVSENTFTIIMQFLILSIAQLVGGTTNSEFFDKPLPKH